MQEISSCRSSSLRNHILHNNQRWREFALLEKSIGKIESGFIVVGANFHELAKFRFGLGSLPLLYQRPTKEFSQRDIVRRNAQCLTKRLNS